ncbi:hypothetical protein [Paenibacillus hamazuiensis]|uniref:hypothetical protein n=1 Tax=Paenibacillus hamazuiensis TaxID=2936508 RepID=UPI00200FCA91|nr:hypothetical protein [Paenibacillus hamazuiensis]
MNKIGFTAKQRPNKYYKRRKWLKNTFLLLSPIAITIVLIYCIFIVLPHKAWIYANGSPREINITHFEGRIDSKASTMMSSDSTLKGIIINQQSLIMNLDGEDFNLQPGDLQIQYGYSMNHPKHFTAISSNVPVQFDMLDMNLSQLNLKKEYFLQRFGSLPTTYLLSIDNKKTDLSFSATIYEKNFKLILQGNLEVFIKGKKYPSNFPYYEMNFVNPDEKSHISYFQFENFDHFNLLIPAEKGELLFTGRGETSNLFFEKGDLKFNQTTNEKQFSLSGKRLITSSINGEKLDIAYSLNRDSQMEIYGTIGDGTLTGNSLFLNFTQWLIENITTVLGMLISILLGLIIVKKNK